MILVKALPNYAQLNILSCKWRCSKVVSFLQVSPTKTLYAFVFFSIRAIFPAYLIFLDVSEENKTCRSGSSLFWDVTQRTLVDIYGCFGTAYRSL
jgi:hypothetical protein